MLDLSSTHYQLSNAPSLVPVLKAVLHNFTKQLNEVWWYSLDPVVTSLQPQLSPNPDDKNFFEVRFEFYSPLAFQRAIACLCTSNRTLNVSKQSFVVYTHFPHRPGDVTPLPTFG